jgi:flagellar basal-body rod protein FlgG
MGLDGLYAAASGMEAQQTQLDAISNDLANESTPGYQAVRVGFHDLLYTSGGVSSGSTVATGAGAASNIIGRSQQQGSIQETGQPFDIALQGPGFIEVRRPDGTIGLTRNGVLQLNSQRRLTNTLGMEVQPPITVPRGVPVSEVKIAPNGTVYAGNRTIGKIAMVDVPAPDHLLADGSSVFSATAASGPIRPAAAGTTMQQGALEASNVDTSQEMVDMIDTQNNYSMASKAIQFQDQMMQIANQVKK